MTEKVEPKMQEKEVKEGGYISKTGVLHRERRKGFDGNVKCNE